MGVKEELNSAMLNNFYECVDKHMEKIRNCLSGMIFHAYRMGQLDGAKEGKKEGIQEGREEMLKIAQDIILPTTIREGAFTNDELIEVFGYSGVYKTLGMGSEKLVDGAKTIRKIREAAKEAAPEPERERFQVGDVVVPVNPLSAHKEVIVLQVDGDNFTGIGKNFETYTNRMMGHWKKTGKSYVVEGLVTKLKEDGNG